MPNVRVHLIEWGGGNLGSVARAFARLGAEVERVRDPDALARADRLVLPGVGAFGAVLDGLRARGLDLALAERLRAGGRPFLGICVGLQALFEGSEETPGVPGLGLLPGTVSRLRARKVPQVGWNEVLPTARGADILERGHAYFVNSYAAPDAPDADAPWIAARTDHEGAFTSAALLGEALAVQFHPEKSGVYGARLLARWLARS